MARLVVVGVRHHSPACARVVAHTLETLRPRFVLIEGPSDMNDRLGEFYLAHKLPIALFTYRLDLETRAHAHGTWSPFCDYSPEWIALRHGRAIGADVRFIDLPAWHEAFEETENRYSDRHLLVSHRLGELAHELGFDSVDTLWDHLFEHGGEPETIAAELDRYFTELRADEPADEGDVAREAWMAQWLAWAMATAASDETVVVVCGGYHKPALERLWSTVPATLPLLTPLPDSVRVGSNLVPFSYRRLDAFSGYASGMPSPAYYQSVWQDGATAGYEMLSRAARRLREKRQRVSTSDLIAARSLAVGLARLRGHTHPLRADVLDGIVSAWIKEALAAPPPWTTRGPLPRGTDPMLVEIIAEFCGEKNGELAPETPRPPIVGDAFAALAAVNIELGQTPQTIEIDPVDPLASRRRPVLHQLAILGISGIVKVTAADLRRGRRVVESWSVQKLLTTEPNLIERAVYGASLAEAARARLEEVITAATGVADLVGALELAINAGFADMVAGLTTVAVQAIEREVELGAVGDALARLRLMARTLGEERHALAPMFAAAVERAIWIYEGIDGPSASFVKSDVSAVAALRDCLIEEDLLPDTTRVAMTDVFRRRAAAVAAPPALRGAALGALWSVHDAIYAIDAATSADALAIPDHLLGDFLSGLFWLAREEFSGSPLLRVVDERLRGLAGHDFLVALPSLRRSFSFFPPRERLAIAERLVAGGTVTGDARELVATVAEAADVVTAAGIEQALFTLVDSYGLGPS